MDPLSPSSPKPSSLLDWLSSWKIYGEPSVARMLLLGFSAGLPLLLVLGTLSFWLREAGIDRKSIGYLSWIGLAYGFKWLWAPLVDRVPLPLLTRMLGRRRSWLLIAQLGVVLGLVGMAFSDPKVALSPVVWCAILTAFASATQDIALDAYRIESANEKVQAAMAAAYQTGYRLAMIWAGAGVLWIAARAQADVIGYVHNAWTVGYLVMAASMLVGIVTVLFSPEPPRPSSKQADDAQAAMAQRLESEQALWPAVARAAAWLHSAVVAPFMEFLQRFGWHAVLILALLATYRISDVVMGIMANPFYVDMGYSKEEVATVSKVYGVIMTLVGAAIGGIMALRLGVMRVLFLGAVLSAGSNLLFSWLSLQGHDLTGLIFVISADNLSSGIASAAFIAYMSSLTSAGYTATQYALFSSLMALLPKWVAGFSGVAVDTFGYSHFFIGTAIMGLPVLVLVWLAQRMHAAREAPALQIPAPLSKSSEISL